MLPQQVPKHCLKHAFSHSQHARLPHCKRRAHASTSVRRRPNSGAHKPPPQSSVGRSRALLHSRTCASRLATSLEFAGSAPDRQRPPPDNRRVVRASGTLPTEPHAGRTPAWLQEALQNCGGKRSAVEEQDARPDVRRPAVHHAANAPQYARKRLRLRPPPALPGLLVLEARRQAPHGKPCWESYRWEDSALLGAHCSRRTGDVPRWERTSPKGK